MPQYNSGKMVKILAENCKTHVLDSRSGCEDMLRHLCKMLNMTSLSGPYSVKVSSIFGDTENDGVSAILVIAESHIAIHTWSHWRSARIVIDSCKDFDEDVIIQFVHTILTPGKIRVANEIWKDIFIQ